MHKHDKIIKRLWWLATIMLLVTCLYLGEKWDKDKIDMQGVKEPAKIEQKDNQQDKKEDPPIVKDVITNDGLSVFFNVSSAKLSEEDKEDIDRVMSKLDLDNIISIKLDGYADSNGNYDDNMILSEDRAVAVCTYMKLKYNIPDDKFVTTGHSSDNPARDNSSSEGRQWNRRVDITIKSYREGIE